MKKINEIKGLETVKDYYYITTDGEVISTFGDKKRTLATRYDRYGYLRVGLRLTTGEQKTIFIHTLVARAFVDGYESHVTVDHIDGDKENNHFSNLQ
mgnify:CR=1 FL=1